MTDNPPKPTQQPNLAGVQSQPAVHPAEDAFVMALGRAIPAALSLRLKGWAIVACIALIGLAAIIAMASADGDANPVIFLLPIIVVGVFVLEVNKGVRRRQEALIVPHIAHAAGLRYDKDANYFLSAMPVRLLPSGRKRTAEDHVSGTVGGRAVGMAEAKIETGGENSSVLFKGIVARVENVVPLPPFFVALASKTRKNWFGNSALDTDGLMEIDKVSVASQGDYSVWASSSSAIKDSAALAAVLDVLLKPSPRIAFGIKLFSASSDGRNTHIALSYDRDLFSVGGLLPGRAAIDLGVKEAAADLSTPLAILSAVLEAESAVSARTAPKRDD